MRVSVVLCTFNGGAFLHEQLASVLGQSRPVDEIVLSDDASDDRCVDLARTSLARFHGDLRVHLNTSRLGAARNFEQALRLATGEVCFLCDQDDVWRPDKVELMLAEFERDRQLMLLHSDAKIIDQSGTRKRGTLLRRLRVSAHDLAACDAGGAFQVLLRRNIVTGATVALRRCLLEHALPFPDGFWHDEWLALTAAAVGGMRRIDEPLIDYRVHRGNQVGLRGAALTARSRAAFSARGSSHAERARKMDELLKRLHSLGSRVPMERLRLLEACRDHWKLRASLPRGRAERLPLILAQWRRGHYRRFSNGWRGALRDFIGR